MAATNRNPTTARPLADQADFRSAVQGHLDQALTTDGVLVATFRFTGEDVTLEHATWRARLEQFPKALELLRQRLDQLIIQARSIPKPKEGAQT